MLTVMLTAVLVRPLFKAKSLDRWGSIESTLIVEARFLIEHWLHPQWQLLWYAGASFSSAPALPYGTAVISMATGYEPAKA